jgi:hypothetical protein
MSCNTQGAECCAAGESNNASKKQDSCCSSSRGCNSTSDLLPEDDGWNIYRRTLPKNIVLDLLKREAELWHDPEFQKKLGVKYDATYHTDTILDQQRRVLKEFGVKDLEVGLEALHGLRAIYRDDVELIKKMKEIAIYMKYDITRPGDLWKGDQVPDMDLATLDGGRIKLYDYMTKDRPLVLIGGSYS